jgi:hypothetical protein
VGTFPSHHLGLQLHILSLHLGLDMKCHSTTWKWTPNDIYSTRSTYCIQFKGAYGRHKPSLIQKVHAGNKCKVFTWTFIQDKILTTNNLAARVWPHKVSCILCNGPLRPATTCACSALLICRISF